MSLLRWLATIFSFRSLARCGGPGRPSEARRSSFRLTVTILEDRLAPALLTVNTLIDAPVSGTSSTLSLREAIALVDSGGMATDASGHSLAEAKASQIDTANPYGSGDTIRFAPELFGSKQQVVTLDQGTLVLSRSVALLGPRASELAVSGHYQSLVFDVAGDAAVSMAGLTIEAGAALVAGDTAGNGGGIVNTGSLTLTDIAVSGNTASNDGGGIVNWGR